MRNFIFANSFSTSGTTANTIKVENGNIAFLRSNDQGGNIYYPINKKDFSYTKAVASAATQFKATFTIAEIEPYLDYTFVFAQKGKQFNERNKWTATFHTTPTDTVATLLNKFKKYVEDNTKLGLTASVSNTAITFTGSVAGEDYSILASDEIMGLQPTSVTRGKAAFLDKDMVKDLSMKCAADAGYNYTYDDELYPNFGEIPSWFTVGSTVTIYTLRFTEPRVMGTRDENVYQIIQIAFPSAQTSFEEFLDTEFLGKVVEAPEEEEE